MGLASSRTTAVSPFWLLPVSDCGSVCFEAGRGAGRSRVASHKDSLSVPLPLWDAWWVVLGHNHSSSSCNASWTFIPSVLPCQQSMKGQFFTEGQGEPLPHPFSEDLLGLGHVCSAKGLSLWLGVNFEVNRHGDQQWSPGFLFDFCSIHEISSLRLGLHAGLRPTLPGPLLRISWFSQATIVRGKFWHHPIRLLGHTEALPYQPLHFLKPTGLPSPTGDSVLRGDVGMQLSR